MIGNYWKYQASRRVYFSSLPFIQHIPLYPYSVTITHAVDHAVVECLSLTAHKDGYLFPPEPLAGLRY
jgi:hypothetical protein